jgi:glutamate racemase
MAIGVFDSGVGGLTIHRALTHRLPAADFIYLADQAHVPYGSRSGQEIVELTRTCCDRLVGEGCDLIILACNTASAVALRQLQQGWVPGRRETLGRPVNVLGIIVPTIEAATGKPWHGPHDSSDPEGKAHELVAVFATQATARAQVYEIEITKRRRDVSVFTEACPGLAALVERGAGTPEICRVIEAHVAPLIRAAGRAPDKAILGSTHYEVVADLFRAALPPQTELIHQPRAIADALESYLTRHLEFRVGSAGLRRFLTTGRPGVQHALVERYWGTPLCFEAAR